MNTKQLITKLQRLDPNGEMPVKYWDVTFVTERPINGVNTRRQKDMLEIILTNRLDMGDR